MALFGRKKPKKKFLIYAEGKEALRAPLIEIPIREEVIIEKSIAFFDDPEPCYIHRGAVVTRLAGEIEDAIIAAGGKLQGEKISDEIRRYVNIDSLDSLEVIME